MLNRRSVGWTSLSNMFNAFIQLLQLYLLTKFLVPADFGLLAIASSFAVIVLVFQDFGLSGFVVHAQSLDRNHLSSLYWFTVAVGCGVALCTAAVAWPFSLFYHQPQVASLLYVYALNFVLIGLLSQYQARLQKDFRFKTLALVDMGSRVAGLGAALAVAAAGGGAFAIAIGLALTSLSRIVVLFLRCPEYRPAWHFKWQECRPAMAYGLYQMGAQIISQLSGQLDSLILGRFIPGAELGLYALSKDLSIKVSGFVNPVIQKVGMPHLAKIQHEKDLLGVAYAGYVRIISRVNAMIYALVAIFAVPIVLTIYGQAYAQCAVYLTGLCFFGYCRCVLSTIGILLQATGRTRYDLQWNLCAIVLSFLATLAGAQFGVAGVVLSNTLLMTVFLLLVWVFVTRRVIDISFRAYTALFGLDLVLLGAVILFQYWVDGWPAHLLSALVLLLMALRSIPALSLRPGQWLRRKTP